MSLIEGKSLAANTTCIKEGDNHVQIGLTRQLIQKSSMKAIERNLENEKTPELRILIPCLV